VLDEDGLLKRARDLAGLPLSSLATFATASAKTKGGIGELIERALGFMPSSSPEPDVPSLGIEIKTLPVEGATARVVESTWVCSASPDALKVETWSTSRARKKLARVLFVPVESARSGDVDKRRVGTAFLWSPTVDEEDVLRADWEDLADIVAHGLGFAVTARRGRALQLRPKARDASVRRIATDVAGDEYVDAPQGFYLRRSFTQRIVDDVFAPR